MNYYNQYDYPHVPYPSPTLPKATVSSGGCGVCCASMVSEALCGIAMPPERMAEFSISKGARVAGGTDMSRLAAALEREFDLVFRKSSGLDELILTLSEGGMAICNVSGDTVQRRGVFSNGGHYIVASGIAPDSRIIVYDPGLYKGKYDLPHRRGQVECEGEKLLVRAGVLHADCAASKTRYYLFKGGFDMTQERFEAMAGQWQAEVNPIYETLEDVPEYWREDVKELMALGAIKGDGKKSVAMRRETLKAVIVAHRLFKEAGK